MNQKLQELFDESYTGSRIGRRAFLKRAAAFGLVAIPTATLLQACGGDDDDDDDTGDEDGGGQPTEPAASGEPTATTADDEPEPAEDQEPSEGQGGTLIIDLGSEPENLDPHQGLAATTGLLTTQIFDSLLKFEFGTLDIGPWLAESWEGSEDGLIWTFHLRDGVTFHDGTPLDAEAVKFNYDRQFDPENEYSELGEWSDQAFYDFVTGVRVDGPLDVTFELETFLTSAVNRLGFFTVVSPDAVAEHREAFTENPVGSGPYQFNRWDKGQQVVLERNESYWRGTPGLDQVVFRAITEDGARAAALLSGEVQMTVEISPEIMEQIEPEENLEVVAGPTGSLWFLALNVEFEPFSDLRVRQAVNFAIDKETIVRDVLNDSAELAHGPLAPSYVHYNPAVEDYYTYDPDRARELLDEAGFVDQEVVFRSSIGGSGMLAPEEMATVIQDNLRDVGISTSLEVTEFVSWMDAIRNPQNELTVMSWNLAPTDPDFMFNGILSESSLPPGFNTSYWVNEEFEELIEVGRTSLDPDEVEAAYYRCQEIVMEEAPIVPVCHRQQIYGVSSRVKNFDVYPSMALYLQEVYIEE